ncbi:MAG: metal-dependent transcriptional regulator [Sphingobacteriales bacterium]|jgi:DtxR family Mn-dependent transcriptional regulator|nr:metal-dependent transcriptional regulator [Sphingobacteriales bacterium]
MRYTTSEENYLKAIFHLGHGQQEAVLTSEIASNLNTTAASVTDMLKKLSEKELVSYERYRGVRVTRKGERAALDVIRRHRLWEVFLTDVLKFGWDEVHHLAEELEHVSSDELISRLDRFLGHPRFDPHGDPIPDKNGKLLAGKVRSLDGVNQGSDWVVSGVLDDATPFLQFLNRKGIRPGIRLNVIHIDPYDQSMLVAVESGREEYLSFDVTQLITVAQA